MPRAFAVIPAAGQSRRMGRPKLLLPWGEGVLVDGVIDAYRKAGVDAIAAVVHPDDHGLAQHLADGGVDVVIPPAPPPEMKVSVRLALEHFRRAFKPTGDDVWLLAPADMPELSAEVTRHVIESAAQHPGVIIMPTHQGRNGHPALFPWPLADEVARLAENEGVDVLLRRHAVVRIECGAAALAADVDTPDDYRRLSSDE